MRDLLRTNAVWIPVVLIMWLAFGADLLSMVIGVVIAIALWETLAWVARYARKRTRT